MKVNFKNKMVFTFIHFGNKVNCPSVKFELPIIGSKLYKNIMGCVFLKKFQVKVPPYSRRPYLLGVSFGFECSNLLWASRYKSYIISWNYIPKYINMQWIQAFWMLKCFVTNYLLIMKFFDNFYILGKAFA